MSKNSFFSTHDSDWLDSELIKVGVDEISLRSGPPVAISFDQRPVFHKIDLSGKRFISLFDMLNLFLLIDLVQAKYGGVEVLFPGISDPDFQLMNIDLFNKLRRQGQEKVRLSQDADLFEISQSIYNLLAFCVHFGLFDRTMYLKDVSRLFFPGLSKSVLEKLYAYSSAKKEGSKVLGLFPILGESEVSVFRSSNTIDNWINALANDNLKKLPIFKDGEFSRVFSYQLALNMVQHSGEEYRGEYGAFGAVAMRIVPPGFRSWYSASFPKEMLPFFKERDGCLGFLEICAGDRGCGIYSSLKEALQALRGKFGIPNPPSVKDVISFAFDELGTRKRPEERVGGVHALHRILKCVAKYHGLLRVRSSGVELFYDPEAEGVPHRHPTGLGVSPSAEREVLHPYGMQMQILLPLMPAKRARRLVYQRASQYVPQDFGPSLLKVVSVAAHFSPVGAGAALSENVAMQLSGLAEHLMVETANKKIIYDFGSAAWSEEEIAFFLRSQKSVLHTHFCLGINLDAGIAKLLRDREALGVPKNPFVGGETQEQFFDVLSSKHRIFPVSDTSDNVWWFGLGEYSLDDCLSDIFISGKSYSINDLSKLAKDTLCDYASLAHYLNCNEQLFGVEEEKKKICWKCKVSVKFFDYIKRIIVRERLQKILDEYGCVKKDGFFKLPSRKDFAKSFIHSTPLLQDNVISGQIADLICPHVEKILEEKNIIFACATAPAELFARVVSSRMRRHKAHILNLGYYSSLDRAKLAMSHDWEMAVFIVADVIDKEKTVRKVEEKLRLMGLQVRGVISLVQFCDNKESHDVEVSLEWRNSFTSDGTGEVLPCLSLCEIGRPELVEEEKVKEQEAQLPNPDVDLLRFVEPFSLEIFNYSSLSRSSYSNAPKAPTNTERINRLEDIKALRAGHWVYGSHHFKVATCVDKMLEDDSIGGEICHQLIEICIDRKIDHILLPLHSRVGDIIDRVMTGLKLTAGLDIDYTYCVSTKVLASRGFYVLPEKLKEMIRHAGARVAKGGAGLHFLLIDDAVATGRTLDTLMRALILEARRYAFKGSPIDHVHAYAILDRQGRARGTMLTGVSRVNLFGDGEWEARSAGDFSFNFKFERWLDVDLPVDEKEACSLCREREALLAMRDSLPRLSEQVKEEVVRRIDALAPRLIDGANFYKDGARELSRAVDIGQFEAKTAELALWEFVNQLQRGCPFTYLIGEYISVSKQLAGCSGDGDNYLKSEMLRVFFRDWARLASQWAGPKFLGALDSELSGGTELVRVILSEAGRSLAMENSAPGVLKKIFRKAVHELAVTEEEEDKNCVKRQNLAVGCMMFCLYYRYFKSMRDDVMEGISEDDSFDVGAVIEEEKERLKVSTYSKFAFEEILRVYESATFTDNFVASLREVLNQTIRAARHKHAHLLPHIIASIIRGARFNTNERKMIRDRILSLKRSLDVVKEKFVTLFDEDSWAILPVLDVRLNKLQKSLSTNWEDDKPNETVKRHAANLRNIYPIQRTNAIYKCLVDIHFPFREIISWLKMECEAEGILVITKFDIEIDQLYIMAPSKMDLQGILRNFTSEVKVEDDFCKNPTIFLYVTEKTGDDSIKSVVLHIYSNLRSTEKIKNGLPSGPAFNELGRPELKLFGIKGDYEIPPNSSPDGKDYSVMISIEFNKGYKLMSLKEA